MSSNGTKKESHQTADAGSVFYHPVLRDLVEKDGQFGAFKNFRLSRPFLHPDTGKSVSSQWHNLKQDTLDQMRRHLDDLQEILDADNKTKRQAAKKNGTPRRAAAKKRKAAKRASASR